MPYITHNERNNGQMPDAQTTVELSEPNVAGVCKDCYNGTLNNNLREAFDYNGFGYYCLNCGSTHVDLVEAF